MNKNKIDILCNNSTVLYFSDIKKFIINIILNISKFNGIFLNLSLIDNSIIDELFIIYNDKKSIIINDINNIII